MLYQPEARGAAGQASRPAGCPPRTDGGQAVQHCHYRYA